MSVHKELHTLNPSQKKAVEKSDGRLLILAGAGSGKTRVLTLRMAYLITCRNVSPDSILGLTFTNKAAAEMRHRLSSLIDSKAAKSVTLSTFHGFCMQVLRREIEHLGYTSGFSLYDEQDVQRLINLIARDILGHEGELPSLAPTLALIRQAKNKGSDPESASGDPNWHDDFTREVYSRLQASMRAYNAVDFDNLLGLCVELFEKNPEVLDKYRNRFRYIMIDEYQDTNPVQYRLASLLSSKHENLCVVGDDDQSIYGWRGADVKNILRFDRALVITLEQNYRSTNTILGAANAVIKNNLNRHPKALWSDKGEGERIEVFHAPNETEEAAAVVKRLVALKELHSLKWSDFAVLYRSNALSRQFEHALLRHTWKNEDRWICGIPYEIFGGVQFYERKEVKDLCAYLRVIVNPLDQEALLRIVNQPRRGIGEETLDSLTGYNRSKKIPLWDVLVRAVSGNEHSEEFSISGRARKGLEDFISAIVEAQNRFESAGLAETMEWLIERIDYKRAIKEEVKSSQMREFKAENVREFIDSLKEFEERPDVLPEERSLATFVADLALDDRLSKINRAKSRADTVSLMTFHGAKGLEFPVCFLVGLEDHIIPHEKSMQETGLEEERRLMYVAITRAKHRLILSMAKQRKRMGKDCASLPSRFLFEIPKELLNVTDSKSF